MQPDSGGFLEAVAADQLRGDEPGGHAARAAHPVVRRGVSFLLKSARPDGSWPIDTNLATWVTTLSINALAAATGDVGALGCLDWLLSCQHQQLHPFTHAAPGGWGWSDLSGAVPDVDDTSGALLGARRAAAVARPRKSGAHTNVGRGRSKMAPGHSERRRRLAHVLPRLGRVAVRSQRQRPDGPRHPRPPRLARDDPRGTHHAGHRARTGLSRRAAAGRRQLGSAVVRQSASTRTKRTRSTGPAACCWPTAIWDASAKSLPAAGWLIWQGTVPDVRAAQRNDWPTVPHRRDVHRPGGPPGGWGQPIAATRDCGTDLGGWSRRLKGADIGKLRRSVYTLPNYGIMKGCIRLRSSWRPWGRPSGQRPRQPRTRRASPAAK